MKIETTSFTPDGTIGDRYIAEAAGGENVNPALAWSEVPEGTKSFALTIYDPDAPTGSGFWHWIVYNIPADVREIAEGAGAPAGASEFPSDYGFAEYGGPNPPAGPAHRYIHTIHALPVEKLQAPEGITQAAIRFQIHTQQLDSASVTGLYGQKA